MVKYLPKLLFSMILISALAVGVSSCGKVSGPTGGAAKQQEVVTQKQVVPSGQKNVTTSTKQVTTETKTKQCKQCNKKHKKTTKSTGSTPTQPAAGGSTSK